MGKGRHLGFNSELQTVLGPVIFKKNLYVHICSTGIVFLQYWHLKVNGCVSLRNYPVHSKTFMLAQLRKCMEYNTQTVIP